MANKKYKTDEERKNAMKQSLAKARAKYNKTIAKIVCNIEDKEYVANYAEKHDITQIEALHILLQGAKKND